MLVHPVEIVKVGPRLLLVLADGNLMNYGADSVVLLSPHLDQYLRSFKE